MSTQLNVDELKDFLKHMVKNNQHIQNEGKVPVEEAIQFLNTTTTVSALKWD